MRIRVYRVSTAAKGPGCQLGSLCTPTGKFRVARKIGDGEPLGVVFRDRVPSGEVWSADVSNPLSGSKEDLVLSRILWLEGIEDHNRNTKDRYIYLHGTNQEALLGEPASHGCIRFSNADIIELFGLLPEGADVQIE